MLQPKKPKYRKKNNLKEECMVFQKGNLLNFGSFGLKSFIPARITSGEIEAQKKNNFKTFEKI